MNSVFKKKFASSKHLIFKNFGFNWILFALFLKDDIHLIW